MIGSAQNANGTNEGQSISVDSGNDQRKNATDRGSWRQSNREDRSNHLMGDTMDEWNRSKVESQSKTKDWRGDDDEGVCALENASTFFQGGR